MSSNKLSTDLTGGFTPKEIRFLHSLENVISYAHLHCQDESKTYAILIDLLSFYKGLFWSDDPGVSIFITPQDKLVGLEEMHVAPSEKPVRVIPDMTVTIARRSRDGRGKSDCQLVLVIEAKRLCVDTSTSLSPWFNLEAGKIESSEVFSRSLGQLMLQSWCSWSTFPTQEHLFLKLLTGPFITVVKFPRPPGAPAGLSKNPTTGQEGGSQPRKRRRVEEGDEEEITTNLHELIPRAYSPKLVVWCHHIFTDPHNPARGLSAALRYVLHCTTEDIIKRFDQGLQMEESSIFNFAGFTDDEFKETEEAQSFFAGAVATWYEQKEHSGVHTDYAAEAEREDQAKLKIEAEVTQSPLRLYYREPKTFGADGVPFSSPSSSSAYTPSPEQPKRIGGASNPPSSPSPLELSSGSFVYSTRYQVQRRSQPQ